MDYKNLKQILENFGERVVKLSKINIGATRIVKGKKRRIDFTGTLRNSIKYNLKIFPNSFTIGFEMEDYGENVDKGRKPGKGAPPSEILNWVKKKPIRIRDLETGSFIRATEARQKSLAYLINRKIKREGIEPTFFFTEPLEKEFKTLPNDIVGNIDLNNFIDD